MTTRIRPGNGAPKKYYGLIRAKKPEQKPIPANHKCKMPWNFFGHIPNDSYFRCKCGRVWRLDSLHNKWVYANENEWIKAGGSI